ncbi:mannose-1-phosphate guanylyltransferase/mannose-6-phosphate isomerase [Alterisphingorhabdus coralli]|uniref:mannose-1-phosphate guanylyltransferase n=1 Tax=Alterisphingorhabdus coralli TaxID=3071408 RepID=A0AA97F5N2_9SPHN|nr:mannose-1-phosphate guanylyltransferase/mannose-6-phosphate isomerase [Parasphingorhabdus sp. SCSIO 66989]WOE74819.1 mannose-1-phosphate guanylyltransferase/mannose-6-phosphate isomerase [Parasphingorhabdus sp. SCSIO 66989]
MITPVILSGGSGTRLWPRSTDARPKQFLPLAEERTMFAATLDRVRDNTQFAPPLIIGNAAHHKLMAAELDAAGLGDNARIILEPAARNTAPAIALAALELADDSLMLVMPSDHVMRAPEIFCAVVAEAEQAAQSGALVTFGITPTHPETGYGYIHQGAPLDGSTGHKVKAFVEKPKRDVAEQMLAEGGYLWNAGIFLMRADRYLEELQCHSPEMIEACTKAHQAAARDGNAIMPNAESFGASPSDSIDYAIMEKADNVAVFALDCGWSDLGSWDAVYDLAEKDASGNAHSGPVTSLETSNTLIQSDGLKIAAAGVSDLIIIAEGDQLLIVPRGESQRVKQLLAATKDKSD